MWLKKMIMITIAASASIFLPVVQGQQSPQGQPQQPSAPLTIEQVKPGLYAILNPGANTIAVRVTNEGVILVDDMPEGYYGRIIERIKSVTDQPVKYVISTHHHNDHTGGNAQFRAANSQLVGHKNARGNMACGPNANNAGAPGITFTDEAAIYLGGAEVQLHHLGRGHSDGDTVVYFPDLKVMATGDLFTAFLNPPRIETGCGGSSFEWIKTMDKVLKFDFDRVIPGHGPVSTKEDVAKKKRGMEALQERTIDLIRRGVPKEQYLTQVKVDDLGWVFGPAFGRDGWGSFWDEMAASIRK